MKKAVFFDIDGTLWDASMRIPPSTAEAIGALRKNGHYAFLCSGRSKSNIKSPKLLSLGFEIQDQDLSEPGYMRYDGAHTIYTFSVLLCDDEDFPVEQFRDMLEAISTSLSAGKNVPESFSAYRWITVCEPMLHLLPRIEMQLFGVFLMELPSKV